MKIYFVDLALPKDCPMCPLAHYNKQDEFTGCEVVLGKKYAMAKDPIYAASSERPGWCPLVEGEPPKQKKPRTFKPPTLQEITEYCASRNNMVDPKKFYDYFNAGDWMDSDGKPVKNWKQKIITWEGRNGSKQFYPNAQNSTAAGKTKSKFHYDNA